MDTTLFLHGAAVSAAVGAYHHLVYPAAMALIGRVPGADTSDLPANLPSIEVLMPAYNEGRYITSKLDALAAIDYPADRLTVVIGCDGCNDDTADQVRDAARRHPGLDIRLREFSTNRGKTMVLNDLIRSTEAELVVFTDVSAIPAEDSFKRLAKWFADPLVGAVGGGYALPPDAGASQKIYWRYQTAIKRGESRIAGLIGAHGAFYAVRLSRLAPVPPDTINDDFVLPLQVACDGWKTVYDDAIRIQEGETDGATADSRRRRRIGAGNLQQALRLAGPVLKSGQLGLGLAFLSGKGLRVLMGPLLLLGMGFLALSAPYSEMAAGLLGIAVLAGLLPGPGRYAMNGHLQSMIGAIQYLAGGYRRWSRIATEHETSPVGGETI